jgi:hypothetical protein
MRAANIAFHGVCRTRFRFPVVKMKNASVARRIMIAVS